MAWGCHVCVWWDASSIDWRNIRRGSWRTTKISTSQSCYLATILLSRFVFFLFFTPWHNAFEREVQQELWDNCLFITLGGHNSFIEEGIYDFFIWIYFHKCFEHKAFIMWSLACNMKLGWIAKKWINYKPSIHKGQFGSHCNYAGIKQIDYLVGFESLTRLQLDNNNLAKIERLDHLITLTELGTTTMSGALQFGGFFWICNFFIDHQNSRHFLS